MWYIDVLPDLVDSYNRSKHRSIQKKPINVTQNNEQEVWHTLYGKRENKEAIKYKFEIGDQVRISKMKLFKTNFSIFQKKFSPLVNKYLVNLLCIN